MSRSGYSDDLDQGALNIYRANVDRALAGKRGQKFLREMLVALDAMPVKELVAGEIVRDDAHVCAIGAVAIARKVDVSALDVYDQEEVGKTFGVARAMAAEIAYENDERGFRYVDGKYRDDTPEERWTRMRAWVAGQITPAVPAVSEPLRPIRGETTERKRT